MAELARSGFAEHLTWLDTLFVQIRKMNEAAVQMLRAIAEHAEQNCPSKAYGPYFEARGFPSFLSRGLGSLIISLGNGQADEAKRMAAVIEAIRFLARGDRQKRAILSRARVLLAAREETAIVDKLFRNVGLHEGEFLRLLQTAIDGEAIDRERIKTIAAAVASSVRRALGPKISAASAAHELFLETNAYARLGAGYARSGIDGKYTDPRTQATRQEFDDRDFDPRPAYRRLKRRGLVKTGSSRSPIR